MTEILVHLRIMMGRISSERGVALQRAVACVLACGLWACGTSDEKESTLFEPLAPAGTVRDVPPDPPATSPVASQGSATPGNEVVVQPTEVAPATPPTAVLPMENPMAAAGDKQPGACKAALGVPAAPETIPQVLVLLNTLPKPTTLACFLQALERPLNVYFTSSFYSLQPAPDAKSPRTFLQRGNLYMSIVFGGTAMDTLEFGYRYVPNRSIKAEIQFPITRDLTEETLFDRVARTDTTTVCGDCHVSEAHEEFPGFSEGVYASEIFEPYGEMEIPLETMRAEAMNCGETAGDVRCDMLSALFKNGALVQGTLPGKQED